MGGLGGAGDPALDLRILDCVRECRERLRRLIAGLHLQARPVDGAPIEPRRGAGLEPPEGKPEPFQGERQADRRRLADPSRRSALLADVDEAAQKGAGGQDHCGRREAAAIAEPDAGRGASVDEEIVGLTLDHRQIRTSADRPLHRCRVEPPIGLRPRTANRRTLAPVEDAKLDAALVGDPAHQSIEGIDLADEMALAQAADGGITGHGADGVESVRDECGPCAHARGRSGSLAAGVPAAYHDDIVMSVHRQMIPNDGLLVAAVSARQRASWRGCFT